MRHRQRGITFIGWVFLIVPIGLVAYAGIRLAPIYMDDAKLGGVLEKTRDEFRLEPTARRDAISNSLGRRLEVEYLSEPALQDIDIRRSGTGWVLEVAYERQVPLFGNLSALVEFDHSVQID